MSPFVETAHAIAVVLVTLRPVQFLPDLWQRTVVGDDQRVIPRTCKRPGRVRHKLAGLVEIGAVPRGRDLLPGRDHRDARRRRLAGRLVGGHDQHGRLRFGCGRLLGGLRIIGERGRGTCDHDPAADHQCSEECAEHERDLLFAKAVHNSIRPAGPPGADKTRWFAVTVGGAGRG